MTTTTTGEQIVIATTAYRITGDGQEKGDTTHAIMDADRYEDWLEYHLATTRDHFEKNGALTKHTGHDDTTRWVYHHHRVTGPKAEKIIAGVAR